MFFLRRSVCFSVTVWTSLLSSSFRRSLSSVRRYHGIFSFVLSSIHVDRFEKRMLPFWEILRTEYDALIESAYFPVHEVMGLSPFSLDSFLNGVPCSQFRGTRFRATWLLKRQIFHGFHLPCREEEKSISIKKKADVRGLSL